MKKRLLSAFMALALCLTLLPTAALAEEDTPEGGAIVQEEQQEEQEEAPAAESPAVSEQAAGAVAEVDGTTYSDLIAAFDAAQEKPSATVKLLADVATNGLSSRTHRGTGTGAGNYIFEQGNVTFDLNGHTLMWTKYDVYSTSLVVGDNGRLTIRDSGTGGKIYNEETQALQIYAGTLNIQSGTVVSESNKALKIIGGDVSITGGTIHSGRYFGEGVSISPDTVNNRTATLTISGGAELKGGTNGSGLYVDHVGDENPLVKLSGGTYTGGSSGINCYNTTVGTLLDENCRYMLSGSEVTDTGVAALGSGVTVEADPNAPVEYIDADGNPAKHTNCTEITADTAKLTDIWYVVKENVTINGNLPVTGSEDVDLILCDGATLTISDALTVENDAVLNLYFQSNGTGKLTVGNSTGTVTAPAGEMKKTTGDSSTTFEKCKDHLWTYTNNGENHTTRCDLCGKDGGAVNHRYTGWTDNGDGTHTGKCVCGAESTEKHTLALTPNADDLTHSGKCGVCGYAAAAESHNFDQTDEYGKKCECGAYLAAEYNGQQYATLARAIEAAKNGGTVTLQMDVGERITVNDGMNVTIDLNNNGWTTDGNTAHATLVVTGGSVTVQNGRLTSGTSSNAYTAVVVEGGKLTVGEDMTIQGGSMDADSQFPAIDVKGGELTLSVGAKLDGGMKVSVEGKQLKDYLPEGTAFRLRSYDESTGTWAEDKGLLNAYTTNVYNIPNMALVVVEHTKHEFARNSDGKYTCACGYVCPHDKFENGVCTVCRNECAHKITESTDAAGNVTAECTVCGAQMAVKITASDNTVTYGTDFKSAMNAAENGTTVTLLADIELGTTPQSRAAITGDGKIVTLDLNGHKITSGWLDVGSDKSPTSCTLKIIGKGSYEPPMYGGIITVDVKATLDLSKWEGGTINAINISDNSNYEAETREAAVIVGPNAGTIGKLTFGNNQLDELKKTKLSGGSFNEIWVAGFGPVKLGELLADGYAFQNEDGPYVKYETTLQGASIFNVKVVKCLHPNMEPDETGVATCEYCGKSGKFVASVDGNLYIDMDEAISYWLKNGGTLKLYADYTAADGTWSIGSGLHTINLNGHRMSVKGDGAFKPTHNMHLTVTDGMEIGQIENILLDGSQGGSFTLESGYVGNLEMTGGAVVTLEGGSVDELDVKNCSVNTNLSIQGGSIGKLNIKDWAEDMHVSATGGSLGAYTLPSGVILADVLDHQYYATGTSLDKQVDTAQPVEEFVIRQAPHDFGSTSKAAAVPINGSIPFTVDSPSENVGVYEVKWYRRTNSGAEHMVENKVAGVNVNDTLEVFCVITGLDHPGGAMQWQVAVKGYTIKVVPAKLNGDQTVITQKPGTGNTGNPADNRLVVTPFSSNAFSDVEYKFEVTYNGQPLELNKDYTIKDSSNWARNAGTHTLTIEGMGNYTGQKSVTWTLEPYELSVENYRHAQINKTYDGTDAVTDSTNGIDALGGFIPDSKNLRNPILPTGDNLNLDKSDYELSNMKFDSAEAGDRTFTGTMTLTSGGNFVFANGSRVMQIEYGSGSGRQFVWISSATIAAPAAKALQVANNHAATYTVDLSALLPKLESPKKYGEVTYGAPTVNLSSDYYTDGARVEDGKLILPIQAVKTDTTGSIGSVEVKVSTTNYHDFTLTINVSAKNKLTPVMDGKITASNITYGQALSDSSITGKMKDPNTGATVNGTFTWTDGTINPNAGGYAAEWKFTPTDKAAYTEVTGTAMVEVDKAQQNGKVSMAGYTYGQTPSTPTLTDRTGDGSVTYYYTTTNSNSGGTKWENIQADTLNAGTYYMYAELGETENYGSFTAACVQFRVAKAMPTYTAPTGLTAKYGQTLADVTLPDGWSWMDSSESVGDASNAPKTFRAKFTPTDAVNYNMVENIGLEVMVNKAHGGNLKTVELEQKYTDTSEHTYTPDWAGLPAGQDWTFSSEASIVLPKQDFAADGSLLTYAISGGKAGDKITITLKASCNNYEDFTITLTITLTEKDNQQALRITGGTTVVYGETLQLGTSGGNGNGAVTYAVTNGTGEATIDATGKLTPVKVGKVKVSATKAGDASYNSITSAEVEITITRATPTGEPAYTKITASGKTLADAALGIGTITPAGGTIAWDDPTTTEVVANKSYGWTYTPTDTNYTTRTGTIKLWSKSSGGGSGRTAAVVAPDMPMLYRGCTGDAVKTLQEKLNAKGFDSGNVDGIFGAKTYAAVTAFQKANSLGVDGIVGKLTWAKLYDATPVNVTPITTQPMLRTGSRGDAVRKLQELLNAKGYTCGNVDGIFGSKTYAAVLAFQKANGLAADGIVGPLTWGKLV